MTLANGGLSLALLGADGAGKSTMSKMLNEWLSWKLDVRKHYLGSKQPSPQSKLLYIFFRMARRFHTELSRRWGADRFFMRWLAAIRQICFYTHYLSLAHDRYRRYRSSKKEVATGSIVIYDRFPVAPVLDGPKIMAISNGEFPRLTRVFSRWEKAVYDQFGQPDYFLLLNVHPDVSLQRKPDHRRAAIERKYQVLQKFAAQEAAGHKLILIDASFPVEDVEAQLKHVVWQIL